MKNIKSLIAVLIMTSFLFSCGGGGSGAETEKPRAETPPDTPEEGNSFSLSGHAVGLDASSLRLKVNSIEEVAVDKDGRFLFSTKFTNEQKVSVSIISQPENLQCQIINADSQFNNANIDDVIVYCHGTEQECNKTTDIPQGDLDLSGNNITGIETLVHDIECSSEQWREDANTRIEQHRKTSGLISLVDKNGNPVKNAKVNFSLERHLFNFGGVVQAKMWHGQQGVSSQLYQDTYQGFGFNKAGFQNALKYKLRAGNIDLVPDIMTWLHEQDISVRGHTLIWPGWGNMEAIISEADAEAMNIAATSPSALSNEHLKIYVDTIIKNWAQKWDIDEWDVANEIRGKQDVQNKIGHQEEAHWFKLARLHAKNPSSILYLNENRVISDTDLGTLTSRMQIFESDMLSILDNDGPLDALGFQSRFGLLSNGTLLDAETMYERLKYFDKYDMPIAATEFEIKALAGEKGIIAEIDRAIMTERVMSVYFSKQNVSDILVWTFFSKDDGSQRHIVETDGSPNLRGKTWLYMVKKHWHTNETTFFDRDSKALLNGFKGRYKATVSIPDMPQQVVEFDWIDGNNGVTLKLADYVN